MTDRTRLHGPEGVVPLLHDWLPRQRWFAGKGRPVRGVRVLSWAVFIEGDPTLAHMIVTVDHGDSLDTYQLVIGGRYEIPHRLEHAVIGPLDDSPQPMVVYDATHDTDLTRWLVRFCRDGSEMGPVRFHHAEDAELDTELSSLVVGSEQSNTSFILGDALICKLFRRIEPGLNPDLELTLTLAGAGSPHVAEPVAWFEMPVDGEVTTLGMIQTYLPTASLGWDLALTSVRDLYAEADLHANEVGGDFAPESHRLGTATAEVHRDLARTLPTGELNGDAVAPLAKIMGDRLRHAATTVPQLAPYADALQDIFDALGQVRTPLPIQRIHGDYHLGQVLRSPLQWVLIDFEGEPARPMAERRAMHSPLKDVAAMLRSYDYAARHLLIDYGGSGQHEYRAAEWAERNREAFCDGYAEAAGHDPRSDAVVLRAFETDKAVYEVMYEARNRPSWLPIPLAGIARLAS
ncbi:MAG: maltokinase N-terminal cap-like domain-containing protein [Streptomycetales bacterium]